MVSSASTSTTVSTDLTVVGAVVDSSSTRSDTASSPGATPVRLLNSRSTSGSRSPCHRPTSMPSRVTTISADRGPATAPGSLGTRSIGTAGSMPPSGVGGPRTSAGSPASVPVSR